MWGEHCREDVLCKHRKVEGEYCQKDYYGIASAEKTLQREHAATKQSLGDSGVPLCIPSLCCIYLVSTGKLFSPCFG